MVLKGRLKVNSKSAVRTEDEIRRREVAMAVRALVFILHEISKKGEGEDVLDTECGKQ